MKIAVIGVYYASNLGDAVICDCVASWLRERWPSAEIDIIDIENKKGFEKQKETSLGRLRYCNLKLQWDYWQTKHHIRDCIYYWNKVDVEGRQGFYEEVAGRKYDAAVFAGGQLFMDWLSLDITGFLKCFDKIGTPVYFNACGVGISVSSKIRKELSGCLLKDHVKMISTRDDQKQIEDMYVNHRKQVMKTYDPALWTREVYQVTSVLSSKTVGLGVMYSNHAPLKKITGFWCRLIKELDSRGIQWKMFCNGAINDYSYAAYILKKIGRSKEEHLCECAQEPTELIRQITSFSSLISFRLHSHIIATSYGIPGVAVVWDEKLRFYYRNLGHEERCKTIYDRAESVLEVWENAVNEGYNIDLIQNQKIYSRQLLLDALDREDRVE